MKTVDFLIKLKKNKKLELVEESEEVSQSYLEKSKSNLISSKILLENGLLEESTSLSYYCAYNSLLALLYRVGIRTQNHSASIILLKGIFELDNSFILFAKKERIDKQYYVDFDITKKEVKDFIVNCESFRNELVNFISKLTNDRIKFYRNKFISMLNFK